jgi:shikimate kinase/3-dehydroquinate synthase
MAPDRARGWAPINEDVQDARTMATHALERHVALIGFMGAGKTQLADRLGRRFFDLDVEIEQHLGRSIPELFAEGGEAGFRVVEAERTLDVLLSGRPAVLALGGGAVETPKVREGLREHALTVLVEVAADVAWERVIGSGRPLARDPESFRALYERRRALYDECADVHAHTVEDAVLAAAGIHVGVGALERLRELIPGEGRLALVADAHVAGIYGPPVQVALRPRLVSTHELPEREEAKTVAAVERLWQELHLDRDGTLVALGGGCTTDPAGYVAATYLRGIRWVAVPTTLVGQVDAAIGGKTGINLKHGKNLVGAFHWPERTVIDPGALETLSDRERLEGMSEVVKTGLLAGEPLWELPVPEQVRRCAAYKAGVCLRDPREGGERAILNLGHTFAHALEAASDHHVSHGEAVALGLLAALRLSGLDEQVRLVEDLLRPRPVRADREQAWTALNRDKKRAAGKTRLVLLDAPGRPRHGVELPDEDVRRELDRLIAG